jgi:hypothetical protein
MQVQPPSQTFVVIQDMGNAWAIYDNYIDRVAAQCVNTVTPRWSTKLAGYDVFIWGSMLFDGAGSAHRLGE